MDAINLKKERLKVILEFQNALLSDNEFNKMMLLSDLGILFDKSEGIDATRLVDFMLQNLEGIRQRDSIMTKLIINTSTFLTNTGLSENTPAMKNYLKSFREIVTCLNFEKVTIKFLRDENKRMRREREFNNFAESFRTTVVLTNLVCCHRGIGAEASNKLEASSMIINYVGNKDFAAEAYNHREEIIQRVLKIRRKSEDKVLMYKR